MERRKFISKGIAAGAILPAAYATLVSTEAYASDNSELVEIGTKKAAVNNDIFIERGATGRPHEGKVLAVVQPHVLNRTILRRTQLLNKENKIL